MSFKTFSASQDAPAEPPKNDKPAVVPTVDKAATPSEKPADDAAPAAGS